MLAETTLSKFGERGNFKPTTDIGMWVHIDEERMNGLRNTLEGVEKDGFTMANNALILDVPKDIVTMGQWEDRASQFLDSIKATASKIRAVGSVSTHPCLVGSTESPQIAIFFSTKLDKAKADPSDTENVLLMQFPTLFKTTDRPQSWGIKRQIPSYTGGSGYGKPEIQDILDPK